MRIENSSVKPYSLMAMVGPTGSGKSHWVNLLKEKYPKLKIVSSDRERYEVLDKEEGSIGRYSNEMLEASEAAFHLVKAKVEAYCKLGCQHILVDTTGSPQTLSLLSRIAEEYGYESIAIILALSQKEMERYAPDKERYKKSVKRFQENLSKLKDWRRLEVKERDKFPLLIEEQVLEIDSFNVIGDIHQRCQEIEKLRNKLQSLGGVSISSSVKEVYLGDYFDTKGEVNSRERVEETLSLLEKLKEEGQVLLKGNHENYIAYRLKGGKESEREKEYFNSVPIFLGEEDLRFRFFNIYNYLMDYALINSKGVRYYITHAPCLRKYRCKPGRKENFKFSYDQEEQESLYQQLKFLEDNSRGVTINGHIRHNGDTIQPFRNRYLIETGVTLTGLRCEGYSVTPISVKPTPINNDTPSPKLPSLNPPKELSPEVAIRVERILKGGSRFISGTMPPAPSKDDTLESIEGALDYFQSKGIEELVLEVKHMGSRCTVYINEDDSILLTSRSGLPIKDIPHLHPYLLSIKEELDVESVVLDGELMPWSVLGEGLVKEYEAKMWIYSNLKELGFEIEGIEESQRVLSNYSSREEAYYKPFSILEMKRKGEIVYPEWEMDSNYIKLLLNTPKENYMSVRVEERRRIEEFYQGVINQGLEGIVIRPLRAKDKVLIPYMKVRGRDYLRLVYGLDYTKEEGMLARRRNITGKVKLAIKEWLLGKEMLCNNHRMPYIVDMLGCITQEQSLDPRL